MTSRGKPPAPPVDDDPDDDWGPGRRLDDTSPDLDPSDLLELDADATTPPRGLDTLPGYDLGRRAERMAFFAQWGELIAEIDRRGAARVLLELRDALTKQGNSPEFVDEFVRRIAANAGVTLA